MGVACALVVTALAACGGGEGQAPAGNERVGLAPGGALASGPRATCLDWRGVSAEGRANYVESLHAVFGRRHGRGAVLSDEAAFESIQAACGERFAAEFKIWKVYEKALAFSGFERMAKQAQ